MEEEGKKYNKQAVNADYDSTQTENRGHLLPVSYTVSITEKTSTFTLTNAVPQKKTFNANSWSQMEKCIQYIMDYYINQIKMTCFLVVGAIPSDNDQIHDRVNIPSVMWSAFYCSNTDKQLGAAHWGNNVETPPKTFLVMKTLGDLKNTQAIEPFPGTSPDAFDINDIKDPKVKRNVQNNCRFQ